MAIALPDVALSAEQLIWLKAVYELETAGKQYSYLELRTKLIKGLPAGFLPKSIDSRILAGTRLTLLGVAIVDPNSEMIPVTDRVLNCIKRILFGNTAHVVFAAKEIAESEGLDLIKVQRALTYINDFPFFFSYATGSTPSVLEWATVVTDDVVDTYLKYEGIGQLLLDTVTKVVASKKQENLSSDLDQDFKATISLQFEPNTAFILMSMDPSLPELQDVRNTIKNVCGSFGVQATRVDEIEHSGVVTDLILRKIQSSEFLIADVTGERPNVYYEIGYSHALGKRPILVRKQGTPLHFDLSVHNIPEYKNQTELHDLLQRRLEAITGRRPKI
jgi:hypothetical protein